MLNLRQIIH